MKTYRNQDTVEPGIYFNLRRLHFVSVGERGPLAGQGDEGYRAVPAALILLVAPLVGLAYVIFLPLIGFVLVGRWAAAAAMRRLHRRWRSGQPARLGPAVGRLAGAPVAPLHIERQRAVHASFQDVVAKALAEDVAPQTDGCYSVSHRSPRRRVSELQRVECREGWMRVVKQRRPPCAAGEKSVELAESWTLRATPEGTQVVVECDLRDTDRLAAAAIGDEIDRTLASLDQP